MCFVVVHYKETNVAVKGHVWEFSSAVVVDNSGDFVCECAKAEHVGNGLVINVANDVVMMSHVGSVVVGIGILGLDKTGHAGVRDGSRDKDAGLFRSGRTISFAGILHVAF